MHPVPVAGGNLGGVVFRTVIPEDYFPVPERLGEGAIQCFPNILGLIEAVDYDADFRHFRDLVRIW